MSEKEERLKALVRKRRVLAEEYRRTIFVLSSMEDQIADIDGDIRMLENEQKKESA